MGERVLFAGIWHTSEGDGSGHYVTAYAGELDVWSQSGCTFFVSESVMDQLIKEQAKIKAEIPEADSLIWVTNDGQKVAMLIAADDEYFEVYEPNQFDGMYQTPAWTWWPLDEDELRTVTKVYI